MATSFHESFDNGVGQLSNAWNVDTSVAGQVSLRGSSAMMEWAIGPSAGHGYGTYTIHALFTGSTPGPAIVFWPGDNKWPGQEIDLGEFAFDGSGRQYGIVHWNNNGSDAYQCAIFDTVKGNAWHDYTMVWAPGSLTFKVDGVTTGVLTDHVPTDFEHGGMNDTIGALNNGNSTSLTISDITFTPLDSAPAATTPAPAPTPVSTAAGSGQDTLVVKVSQDAWNGSAQYTVFVDGAQVGGTFTASALHASGQSDTVTLHGSWGGYGHKVVVDFLNDAWGGTAGTDRNLYVDGISYNGTDIPGATLSLLNGGTSAPLSVPATVTAAAPATLTAGTGNDSLVLKVSEDAYKGDAQYIVKVDGVQVGGTFTAQASHGAGQDDTLTLKGNWGTAAHKVEVTFLNDAYDGSPATDRNLYVDGVSYNGHDAGAHATLYPAGPSSINVPATGTTASTAGASTSGTDWNALADQAYANYLATGHWFV